MTDLLDGTLALKVRTDAEDHLKSCTECAQKIKRTETLIQLMRTHPRASIPNELRQDPLAFKLPALIRNKSIKTIWNELPIGIRLLCEGLAIASIVMIGVQIGPKIRGFYEEQMDKKLQSMIAAEDISAFEEGAPLTRGRVDEEGHNETEFTSEEGEETHQPEVSIDPNIKVGKSEVWRFNIKTDSPALVRTKIMKAFEDVGIKKDTPGYGGIEAPGGIQFDLIVPQESIPQLKAQLEKLAAPSSDPAATTTDGLSDTFTWYKNRSKKPIPAGTSRMVIWLSQI